MAKKIILSGIQPSGSLHIGNYLGAIQQWVGLQNDENELLFCIVDLHAITVKQDPKALREKTLEVAALYLACGIDPTKSKIFIQSENPDHPYLSWIFNCLTPLGWMERMTQYKDKTEKHGERTSLGLFAYPTLMAADILLYDTDLVPVGEDQIQHIELTRDIAKRFNSLYGETFKLPQAVVDADGSRIMSLQNPKAKMSKSDIDPSGTINLLDTPDDITRKIKRAVTDSGDEIVFAKDKPALSNLLVIYSKFSGKSIADIEMDYKTQGYGQFKEGLAQEIVKTLAPIQEKYKALRNDNKKLQHILDEGLQVARTKSSKKSEEIRNSVGLIRSA